MILKIAERIKELREAAGLTQTALANELNVTRSAVNAWEMGMSNPSVNNLSDLADYFHVSTDYILGKSSTRLIDSSNIDPEGSDILFRLTHYLSNLNNPPDDI